MNLFKKITGIDVNSTAAKVAIVGGVGAVLAGAAYTVYKLYQKNQNTQKAEESNQYDEIVAEASTAIASDKYDAKAYQKRGRARQKLNQLEAAVEDTACAYYLLKSKPAQNLFEEVITVKSERDAATFMKTRDPVQVSVEFAQTYIASFPGDPVLSAAKDHARITGDPASKPRVPFQEACAKLVAKKFDDVIPHLNQELERDSSPYIKDSLLLRATFYTLSGCPIRAEADLTTLLTMQGLEIRFRSTALMKRGQLRATTSNPETGLDDMIAAGKLDPVNADVFHHRGQIYLLMQDLEQAKKDTSRALTLQMPGHINPSILFQQYLCDLQLATSQNDVEAAFGQMDVGCKKYPKDVECWSIYAQSLTFFGLFEKAEAVYTRAAAQLPQSAKLYVQRAAMVLAWRKDTTRAMEYLNRARDADPHSEAVYENLGMLHLQQGKQKEAVTAFEMQVRYSKNEIECQNTMAMIESINAQIFVKEKFGSTSAGFMNGVPGKRK